MSHKHNKKALLFSFIITTIFMIIEAIGGLVTNSLALLSDAGHMFSDSISLGVSVIAFTVGQKAASYSKTYGYKRFEILAALFNGVTLVVISIYIFYEAVKRFKEPPEVASTGMLTIAIIGLIVNIVVAYVMHGGDTKSNLNVRAAFLHVIGDLIGSIGAIIAAVLIMSFGWNLADPIASIFVALLVLFSAWRVVRDSVQVLMEGTPKNMDIDEIAKMISEVEGVLETHHLHVWSITSDRHVLSCHIVVDDNLTIRQGSSILTNVRKSVEHEDIGHVTVQLEGEEFSHQHKSEWIYRDV